MKFSLVALFAPVLAAAAVPHMAGRNVPDSCDKQLKQCSGGPNADSAVCQTRHNTCLSACGNGFDSCYNAAGITDKNTCWSTYETCAGHRREGDPRP